MASGIAFLDAERAVFRAKPRISTYDWARKNLRVVGGPYKGQLWTPDVTPYARGIMDAFDRRHVRKLFIIAPSQTGKSTLALACLLAQLLRRQDNVGIGMPDQEAVRRYFSVRMKDYFEKVTSLRRLITSGDACMNFSITLADGSNIFGMWAGSDSSMRAESMPYVLIEEEDDFPDKAAAGIMEERADAYVTMELSKIVRVCRPKGTEETSSIWSEAKRQAQAWCVYETRCPVCQEYQVMEHEHIVAVDGSRDSGRILRERLGRYRCRHCGNLWNDSLRDMAVRAGRWVSVTGDLSEATVLAFHLRQWESPQMSLSEILGKWWEAQGNPRALQQWDNNVCAKPYKFTQLETDADKLAAAIDPAAAHGVPPAWTLALTFSADMQMDHFYWSVAAHGLSPERTHVVDYGRVARFDELEQIVFHSRYVSADGRELGIWRAALDTGGTQHVREEDSRTVQAYQWLRSVRQGVVFGTKGMSREVPGVLVKVSKAEEDHTGRKLPHGMTLHLINGDAFKRILFWRLAEGAEEEPVTFHGSTDVEYLRQIASERLEKDKSGREQWKRVRANHYLDCLVGHLALAYWQWSPSLVQLSGGGRHADQ